MTTHYIRRFVCSTCAAPPPRLLLLLLWLLAAAVCRLYIVVISRARWRFTTDGGGGILTDLAAAYVVKAGCQQQLWRSQLVTVVSAASDAQARLISILLLFSCCSHCAQYLYTYSPPLVLFEPVLLTYCSHTRHPLRPWPSLQAPLLILSLTGSRVTVRSNSSSSS